MQVCSTNRIASRASCRSLGPGLLLEVAYSPFGLLAGRHDIRHVRDARFLAQSLQFGFLGFGDFRHFPAPQLRAQRLQNGCLAHAFPRRLKTAKEIHPLIAFWALALSSTAQT